MIAKENERGTGEDAESILNKISRSILRWSFEVAVQADRGHFLGFFGDEKRGEMLEGAAHRAGNSRQFRETVSHRFLDPDQDDAVQSCVAVLQTESFDGIDQAERADNPEIKPA